MHGTSAINGFSQGKTRLRVAAVCVAVLMVFGLMVFGCSGRPGRLKAPEIDAEDAGNKAMAQYDTNGDGAVGGGELQKAPSLAAAFGRLDTDGNGRVSGEEVAARVRFWAARKLGRISTQCLITRNGQPLEGVTVTYEPEEFLSGSISGGSGVTNKQGLAVISVPGVTSPGVPCGLYLVKVTKLEGGRETIPAKYNSETILGREISPYVMQTPIELKY